MESQHLNVLLDSEGRSTESLNDRLHTIHDVIASRYPYIDRVSIAIYDPATELLKTFISSNTDNQPLMHYEASLHDVPSLFTLAKAHKSRIVSHIPSAFAGSNSKHTTWLKDRNYLSSLTVPVYQANKFAAFIFFDSKLTDAFSLESARFLEIFADLISQLFLLQLKVAHGMVAAVQVASGLARIRDLETGQHLERMASYARLIALAVADQYALSDEFIEYIYLFAPLHDIGKIGIPDNVLLKPGQLDQQEWIVMRRHVEIGVSITDKIKQELGFEGSLAAKVMHSVVAYHHERGDGSGYPHGLRMDQIPLEGRIMAVADVYDALSNRRPYKQAWSQDDCMLELRKEMACGRLDELCTEALVSAQSARLEIQAKFADPLRVI